nr:Growth inhibition and differentiation [Hymenolepis microstoma]
MSTPPTKSKRPPVPLYVPPSRRKYQSLQASATSYGNEEKLTDLGSKNCTPTQKLLNPIRKSKDVIESTNENGETNSSQTLSVKNVAISDPFSDLDSSMQRLNLNESFDGNGPIIFGDVRPEVIKVPVGTSTSNYTNPPPLNYEKYQHIIELYDFPTESDTMAIETELASFNSSGYIIKWVDDTHCLAVFSSAFVAEQALKSISGIIIKARPVEKASIASKWKIAKSPGDWSMPFKKRPPSDASVANRFISSHLGLPRPKPSPQLLQARKEAQEKRARRKKLEQEIWGDD